MSGPKLVVKQQKSQLWYFSWALAALVLLFLSYLGGRYQSTQNEEVLANNVETLSRDMEKYQQAYLQANEDLVMQTQTAKVDNQSNQQLIDSVKQLQHSQQQLQAELKFYRNIMAPEKDLQGLTIAKFDLSRRSQNDKPKFKLVLTQAGKQEQFLKGEVEIKLHGKLSGESKVYSFQQLGTFKANDFQFQFRYFQNIEGELVLPDGFTAEFISVLAKTRGLRKNQTAQKQINWTI